MAKFKSQLIHCTLILKYNVIFNFLKKFARCIILAETDTSRSCTCIKINFCQMEIPHFYDSTKFLLKNDNSISNTSYAKSQPFSKYLLKTFCFDEWDKPKSLCDTVLRVNS